MYAGLEKALMSNQLTKTSYFFNVVSSPLLLCATQYTLPLGFTGKRVRTVHTWWGLPATPCQGVPYPALLQSANYIPPSPPQGCAKVLNPYKPTINNNLCHYTDPHVQGGHEKIPVVVGRRIPKPGPCMSSTGCFLPAPSATPIITLLTGCHYFPLVFGVVCPPSSSPPTLIVLSVIQTF